MVWLIISELLESLTMSRRSGATLVIKGGESVQTAELEKWVTPKNQTWIFHTDWRLDLLKHARAREQNRNKDWSHTPHLPQNTQN